MNTINNLVPKGAPWNELSDVPRTMEQIKYMENVFNDKLWYDRHLAAKHRIESGAETVSPEVWTGSLAEAERIRQKYGEENLGPYSDYEWGVLNGKLSALRWVMGCEWDMLDT